jgi:uncharacterized protein
MREIRFDWDENKNHTNQSKHGIDFKEARSVFFDDNAIDYFDPDHSNAEDRYLLIGLSRKARLLIVNYKFIELDESDLIRIFSSRKATKHEQKHYFEGNR